MRFVSAVVAACAIGLRTNGDGRIAARARAHGPTRARTRRRSSAHRLERRAPLVFASGRVLPMTTPPLQPFGALRLPGFRLFVVTFMLTMMADNIEHVISYWVAFQKFHSPALGGFAVVSHWLPYLLFSVPSAR